MSFLARMQSQRANGTSLVFALSLPHVHGLLRAAGPNRTNFALAEPPKLKNFGADFGAAAPTSGLVFGVDGGRGRAAATAAAAAAGEKDARARGGRRERGARLQNTKGCCCCCGCLAARSSLGVARGDESAAAYFSACARIVPHNITSVAC
jgi:hypothetical protein